MFVLGGDEDAAFAVFGTGAAVDADAGATGDLVDGGQEAAELGGAGDGDRIDQGEDEVVGVLEGVADEVQALYRLTGVFVVNVGGAVQFAADGFAIWCFAYKFVVHVSGCFWICSGSPPP